MISAIISRLVMQYQSVHSDRHYKHSIWCIHAVGRQCRACFVSMEAGRARYRDDRHQLPTLSLGLTSVRLIVNQFEAESARVATDAFESSRELIKYDPNINEGHDYDDFPLDSSRGRVWARIAVNLGVGLSRCIPSVSFGNFGVIAVVIGLFAPKMISYLVVYPLCRLVFGTLYPAYASYKAVRTKNLKEYVKWMMYWIVFALFTCTETFTDVFLSWFPFYYEVKIVLVLWLLSPATKGSSILYRKFVHPALCRREQEIDEYIAKAKDQGYHTVLNLGTKGVNYATTVIMQTAIKGGGGLVQQIRKSYSLSDLTECDPREEICTEADDVLAEPRLIRRGGKSPGYGTQRSASESNSRSPMYFPEVDVDVRTARSRTDEPDFSHIKSSEDISSGYSSADNSCSLARAASLGAARRARAARPAVTAIKRPPAAEESEVIIEELHDDDSFEFANMPPLVNLPSPAPIFMSRTDPPFLYQYVGDKIKILQVLGNDPPYFKPNKETNNNTDDRGQTETAKQEDIQKNILDEEEKFQESDVKPSQTNILERDNPMTTKNSDKDENNYNNNNEPSVLNKDPSCSPDVDINEKETRVSNQEPSCPLNVEINEKDSKYKTDNLETEDIETAQKTADETTAHDHLDATSLDTSINDNESVESDDEASFGTPEGSPKSKRKSPKGKYGKGKAPSPPKRDITNDNLMDQDSTVCTTSQESLNDIVNTMPNSTLKETGGLKTGLHVVNPIAEMKRRHKSKSPNRVHKSHTSGISKLLQLPNKLAFWHKSDDKVRSDQGQRLRSTSFGEDNTRSATIEKEAEDFQSCFELSLDNATGKILPSVDISDDLNSFKDACDIENEILSHNIIEKSDALQKLIDAKIESHPEYKFVSLHDEIPTTSKSTDV